MSIQLITFDLDDTLWDVGPVIQSAETRLRDWLGQSWVSASRIRGHFRRH